MTKSNNYEMKAYRKMQKSYNKKLVKLAKDFKPFDWTFMLEIIEVMVDNFETYYKEGNNICQSKESLSQILQQLSEVHSLINILFDDNFDDEAIKFSQEHCHVVVKDLVATRWKKLIIDADANRTIAWETTFQKLGKYMQFWWD